MNSIEVSLPAWACDGLRSDARFQTDQDKMRFVIELARENVLRETGGPFGAAVFERTSGRIVSIGVNSVRRLKNSLLHAEIVAIMLAEAKQQSHTLRDRSAHHELFTSCDPCAMCLGAVLWSGLERLVCGATREHAMSLGFEEGPVFPESYRYLDERGIEIIRGFLADEAGRVLDLYRDRGGTIYNG